MTSATNAAWLANTVFDGARAFEGVAPDLDRHCERVIRSAHALGLQPTKTAEEILALALEGMALFPHGTALYIRPMFWAETGLILIDPASTEFALVITKMPLPDPSKGFTACLSPYRRPGPDQAPTHAKAACLYPLAAMAAAEAKRRGFDNAVMRDPIGNVAEFTAQNIMVVNGGVVHTPIPNGTFLNGITRQRVITLLREAGVEVVERTIAVVRAGRGGRDLRNRQSRQGSAVPPLRGHDIRRRTDGRESPRTVLGVRACPVPAGAAR